MLGPSVHDIDPIITSIFGVHLWWYGLSYSLGFFNAYLFLRRNRGRLGLSRREVYDLTLFLAVGVLIGGRSLVVFNNEWSFYREDMSLIPAIDPAARVGASSRRAARTARRPLRLAVRRSSYSH